MRICLVELFVRSLLGAFLPLTNDIVRIKYRLMLALLVESELLFAADICLLSAHFDDSLGEVVSRLEVGSLAGLLDLVDSCISTHTK